MGFEPGSFTSVCNAHNHWAMTQCDGTQVTVCNQTTPTLCRHVTSTHNTVSIRDLHGDRNHTHPHPSPQTLFPSPSTFTSIPRPSPHNFTSIPVRPRQYLFHPHSIPVRAVPELTAGNRSNINSDAMKEISINSNMDCIPSVYCVHTVQLQKINMQVDYFVTHC